MGPRISRFLAPFFFGVCLVSSAPAQHRSRQDIEKEYLGHAQQAVPRDAFPVLLNPAMGTVADGDKLFQANEWIIGVAINGEAKAYPVTVMGIHELINDTVGGQPITVCW